MDVHNALGVRPGCVDGRMEDEASHVDSEIRGSRIHQVSLLTKTHIRRELRKRKKGLFLSGFIDQTLAE